MNWSVLVVCFCIASCRAAKLDAKVAANHVGPQEKEKGFIEWITHLIGGSTTTASPVVNDPEPTEKECPACQCGIARTKRRIVGGHETKKREFPWMVMLMTNGRMFCGGAVINDLYIMTAAHCTGFRNDRVVIRLLEHDVTDRENDTKTIDRKVSRVIRHQRYNPGTYDNDIALIRLDARLDFSHAIKKRARSDGEESTTEAEATTAAAEMTTSAATTAAAETSGTEPTTEEDDVKVRPVCLPTAGLSYTTECGLVIGWGVTEQGGYVSNTLQEVRVPIVSNKECSDRSYGRRVTPNMLCAGEPDGGRDACQGDSGGPLHVFNETSGKYQEVGVVSWGEGCAQPNKYGVYSRVNRYLSWIKSHTTDACYCD